MRNKREGQGTEDKGEGAEIFVSEDKGLSLDREEIGMEHGMFI